jgi:hypothetical protein
MSDLFRVNLTIKFNEPVRDRKAVLLHIADALYSQINNAEAGLADDGNHTLEYFVSSGNLSYGFYYDGTQLAGRDLP